MFDSTFDSLEKGMKRVVKEQSVHAQNIANRNNPNYEALEFDAELEKAVKDKNARKVNLEKEMAEITKNSERYSAYAKLITQKLNIERIIASQGRK